MKAKRASKAESTVEPRLTEEQKKALRVLLAGARAEVKVYARALIAALRAFAEELEKEGEGK